MKNLFLTFTILVFSSAAYANHWSFSCDYGDDGIEIRITNNKAKVIAPFGTTVFDYKNELGDVRVYEGDRATLLAPNAEYTIGRIPMGASANFTLEEQGPTEALSLTCETRPTLSVDPDLYD